MLGKTLSWYLALLLGPTLGAVQLPLLANFIHLCRGLGAVFAVNCAGTGAVVAPKKTS